MAIVIIEPSSSGIALIEAGRRLGKDVYVLSADVPGRRIDDDARQHATSIMKVETNDIGAVSAALQSIAAAHRIEAVIPGFEYMVETASALAGELGLPSLTPAAARQSRNKFDMRNALRRHGLAVPVYAAVDAAADLERAACHVGFPAVLKPVDACGSINVKRVDSLDELRSAFQEASAGISDMGRPVASQMILERYVAGREFSLEGFVGADGPHVVAVTEKILGPEPYFVEMGHIVDADVTAEMRQAMATYVLDAARAVGLTLGVFHAEVRLSAGGPILMEIAARLGGDRIYRLVELARQVSLPDIMVQSYCGHVLNRQQAEAKTHTVAGVRFLALGAATRFSGMDGIDEVRAMPGCQEAALYYAPGDYIESASDFRCRVGHVLFTAPNRTVLEDRLRSAAERIRVRPTAA